MKANKFTPHVQSKLDGFARAVEHLTEQVARNKSAITGARERLSVVSKPTRNIRLAREPRSAVVADQPAS